jgi:uncharacterized protein (TIGR04255 family)
MAQEVYRNAPIIEAILEIKIRAAEPVSLETLHLVRDPAYPEVQKRPFQLQLRIEGGDSPEESTSEQLNTPLGYFLRSTDEKQVFQARLDGFTFNRLAPYDRWESFSAEARRLWNIYRSNVLVEQVELAALTYMNEISVPFNQDIEDYLNAYVHVPTGLPQQGMNFAFSYQSSLENNALLTIACGVGPKRREGYATIGLFIQAYKSLKDETELSEDSLWSVFEELRMAKSSAFEACITDKVREMIR